MERLSDTAIEIIDDLHTERLEYITEYIPLIDSANKLAEYEDLEEQGLLIKLPCKVGDRVYTIWGEVIYEAYVHCIRPFVFKSYMEFRGNAIISLKDPFFDDGRLIEQEVFIIFGKDTFKTKEEAEAKLKELERGEKE